jgi:hypothetical protein
MVLAISANSEATVITFEELMDDTNLTGSGYYGLTWEHGNPGWGGRIGSWFIPSTWDYPIGNHNVINYWGSTQLGISFPIRVNLSGAFFSAQGSTPYFWTTGVRVHGYRDGEKVSITDWFRNIDESPDWFNISLINIDRIVIESEPSFDSVAGWYGMDNLTYESAPVPEPSTLLLSIFGLIGIGCWKKLKMKTIR